MLHTRSDLFGCKMYSRRMPNKMILREYVTLVVHLAGFRYTTCSSSTRYLTYLSKLRFSSS